MESPEQQQYAQASGQKEAVSTDAEPTYHTPAGPSVKRSRRKLPWILGGAGAALIITLSTAAYAATQTPEAILAKGLDTLIAAKSFTYDSQVSAAFTDSKKSSENGSGRISLTGGYDGSQVGNPKIQATLSGSVTIDGKTYDGAAEGKIVNQTSYAGITKVPKIEQFDISPIVGIWIKYDFSSFRDSHGKSVADYMQPLNDQERKQVREALKKNNPFDNITTKGTEKINDVASRHYQLTINYDKLKALAPELAGVLSRESLSEDEKKELGDSIEPPEKNTPIDVWVSKKTSAINKIASHDELKEGSSSATTDSQITISNLNQPVTVEPVGDAKTLEELEEMAKDDADKDGVSTLLEQYYYKTNPKAADSDGDGFTDGQEIKRGFNPKGAGKSAQQDLTPYQDLVEQGGTDPQGQLTLSTDQLSKILTT